MGYFDLLFSQLGFKELAKLGRSGSAWLRVGAPNGRTTQTVNSREREGSVYPLVPALLLAPSASSDLCVRLTQPLRTPEGSQRAATCSPDLGSIGRPGQGQDVG